MFCFHPEFLRSFLSLFEFTAQHYMLRRRCVHLRPFLGWVDCSPFLLSVSLCGRRCRQGWWLPALLAKKRRKTGQISCFPEASGVRSQVIIIRDNLKRFERTATHGGCPSSGRTLWCVPPQIVHLVATKCREKYFCVDGGEFSPFPAHARPIYSRKALEESRPTSRFSRG